jgi:hypothetical protein
MTTDGLPPGPWKVLTDEDGLPPRVIIDAARRPVLVPLHGDEVGEIECSPEVLRAIEALPVLVEAARGLRTALDGARIDGKDGWAVLEKLMALTEALALVDGVTTSAPGADSAPRP